jgi:hypothetical protein
MKKSNLGNEHLFQFDLYGISCVLKEYKLAWNLNRQLRIQLVKKPDIELNFVNNRSLVISNYLFETENNAVRLIKNKSVNISEDKISLLIPELAHFDYLLIVNGFEDTFSESNLKKSVLSIEQVQFVQKCDLESLKSRDNLIF